MHAPHLLFFSLLTRLLPSPLSHPTAQASLFRYPVPLSIWTHCRNLGNTRITPPSLTCNDYATWAATGVSSISQQLYLDGLSIGGCRSMNHNSSSFFRDVLLEQIGHTLTRANKTTQHYPRCFCLAFAANLVGVVLSYPPSLHIQRLCFFESSLFFVRIGVASCWSLISFAVSLWALLPLPFFPVAGTFIATQTLKIPWPTVGKKNHPTYQPFNSIAVCAFLRWNNSFLSTLLCPSPTSLVPISCPFWPQSS